jgi:hypothetical protein
VGDASIELLVNSAGVVKFGSTIDATVPDIERQISSNVTSLVRLSSAAASAFVARGHGTIVNISSALALNLLPVSAVYSATKSFVLTYSLGLAEDIGPKGVRVQVVLPGAVGTSLWDGSGIELDTLPAETVMSVDDAVDAALAGLDAGELVTLPALADIEDWNAYRAAGAALRPKLSQGTPARRYRDHRAATVR